MRARKVERKRTDIKGQCCTRQGRLFDINVCDLTEGGCRFRDTDRSLFVGAPVSLMIAGSGPYRCFVRWREEDEVGVSFTQPLPPLTLEQFLNGEPVTPVAPTPKLHTATRHAPAVASFGPVRRVC